MIQVLQPFQYDTAHILGENLTAVAKVVSAPVLSTKGFAMTLPTWLMSSLPLIPEPKLHHEVAPAAPKLRKKLHQNCTRSCAKVAQRSGQSYDGVAKINRKFRLPPVVY